MYELRMVIKGNFTMNQPQMAMNMLFGQLRNRICPQNEKWSNFIGELGCKKLQACNCGRKVFPSRLRNLVDKFRLCTPTGRRSRGKQPPLRRLQSTKFVQCWWISYHYESWFYKAHIDSFYQVFRTIILLFYASMNVGVEPMFTCSSNFLKEEDQT